MIAQDGVNAPQGAELQAGALGQIKTALGL